MAKSRKRIRRRRAKAPLGIVLLFLFAAFCITLALELAGLTNFFENDAVSPNPPPTVTEGTV